MESGTNTWAGSVIAAPSRTATEIFTTWRNPVVGELAKATEVFLTVDIIGSAQRRMLSKALGTTHGRERFHTQG
jgi:hypothetical protein